MARWKKLLITLTSLGLVLLAIVVWLTHTASGAQFALRFLPAGITVESVDGSLRGPLRFTKLRVQQPSLTITAERGQFDLGLRSLLESKIRIGGLQLENVVVDLLASEQKADSAQDDTLDLRLQDVSVTNLSIFQQGKPLLDIVSLSAAKLAWHGQALWLDQLQSELSVKNGESFALSGQGRIRPRGQSDLTVLLSREGIILSAKANGDPKRLQISGALANGELQPVQFDVTANDWTQTSKLRYQSTLKTRAGWAALLDPTLAAHIANEIAADLQISGSLQDLHASGSMVLADQSFTIDRLHVSDGGTHWKVVDSELRWAQNGTLRTKGDLSKVMTASSSLELDWTALQFAPLFVARIKWPQGLSSESGKLQLRGPFHALQSQTETPLAIELTADLARQTETQSLRGTLQLSANLQHQMLQLNKLEFAAADGLSGQLSAQGKADWQQGTRWQLEFNVAAFDAALFDPNWASALNGNGTSTGSINGKGDFDLQVDLRELSGELAGLSTSGGGSLRWQAGRAPTSDLNVVWGGNVLRAESDKDGSLLTTFAISNLGDLQRLFPTLEVRGESSGTVRITPVEGRYQLSLDANAKALQWSEFSVADMQARGEIPALENQALQLDIKAAQLTQGEHTLRELSLQAQGTRAQHTLALRASHPQASVQAALSGGLNKSNEWLGSLDSARVQSTALSDANLSLDAPAGLRWKQNALELDTACFSGPGTRACGILNSSAQRVDIAELDLQKISSLFAVQLREQGVASISGQISGSVALAPALAVNLRSSTQSADTALAIELLGQDVDNLRLRFSEFDVQSQNDENGNLISTARAVLHDAGRIEIRNLQAQASGLSGELQLDLQSLKAFGNISESIVAPEGRAQGALQFSVRDGVQNFDGTLDASNVSMELPAFGLKLRNGTAQILANGARLDVRAALESGSGNLQLQGWLMPFATAEQRFAEFQLSGKNALILDTPSSKLIIDPTLSIVHDGSLIRVKGEVLIPEANINLDRFEGGLAPSSDVVVVDDAAPSKGIATQADVALRLGEKVKLKGFGLNGNLSGRVRIRERPNRPSTARGEIEVKGTYKAYGQALEIERGKLLYSASALDDPGLDIRAVRKIEQIKAGVQVRGTALRPELTVWSDPAMEQSDALAYVVLGRPLKGASGEDSALVGQAASALGTAGGNLLARGLGQKVGLELGVETLSDIDGPAFTAGKYLSPSMYVGYGQALFSSQTLFILRYRLFGHYELEALSGREQKIGLNYRREK